MSKRVQFIRHATAAADAFASLEGELHVDTTKKELRVGDGTTAGGIPHARADLDNVDGATISVDGKLIAADKQKLEFITITQNVNLDTLESDVTAALADIVAIETKTDFITITQNVNLDDLEAELAFITVTQNVNLDTMESDTAINNAKDTNANHTGDVTGSAGLTAQAVIISGKTTLTGANLANTDELLINDAGTLKRLTAAEFKNYLYGPQVSGHIRAGNKQLFDREGTYSILTIDSGITENTWVTVGAVASGADKIWTAMDALPSNATILLATAELVVSPGGTGSVVLVLYVTHGDDPSPGAGNFTRIAGFQYDFDADVGTQEVTFEIEIPLGATNQDFYCRWTVTGEDAVSLDLYYNGFIVD